MCFMNRYSCVLSCIDFFPSYIITLYVLFFVGNFRKIAVYIRYTVCNLAFRLYTSLYNRKLCMGRSFAEMFVHLFAFSEVFIGLPFHTFHEIVI